MKAKFFLSGLCALALVACSIDETTKVNDTNAISFKATTATRATAVTTNDINAFTVWAWETVGDATTEFMDGVEAARNGNSNTFTTARTYYWPGAPLDFYAFIPAATVETDDSTGEETVYFGGKITPNNEVIEGDDGTYEFPTYVATATITDPSNISFDVFVPTEAEEGIDLGYAATLGQSTGTVSLNFRHAFSQVAFKAMNGNADWTVDIQGVTLCGIYKEGTYTLPEFDENGTTVHNAANAEKGEWDVENSVKGRFNAGIAATTFEGTSSASQSITAENGALMLIPQTVAAWDPIADPTNTECGAYVRIMCKVTDGDEQLWPNYNEADTDYVLPEYAEITVPLEVDWAEGNLYTYTIVFGEGLGYYAPDDENPDLDGMPVLIPIRFTVDIEDFGNLDEVEVSTEAETPEPTPVPTNHYEEYLYTGGVQIGDRFYTSEELDSTTTGVTEITSSDYKDFPSGSTHYFNGVYFVDSTDENGDVITVNFSSVGNIEKLIMIGTDFDKKSKVKLGTDYAFFPEPYDKMTVEVVLYNLEIDCTNSNYSLVTIMREAGAVDYIAIVDCDISLNKESYHGLIGTSDSNLNQYFTEAYISNCVCSLGPSSTSIINLGDIATGTVESLTMTNNLFYDASNGNDEDDFHIFAGANSPVGKFVYNNNTVVDMNTETGAFKCASIGDVTAQYNLTYVDNPQERGYPNNYLDFVFFCIGEEGSNVPTGTTSISDNIAYHGGGVYTTQGLHWYWFKGESEDTWKAPTGFTDCQVITEDPFSELNVSTGVFTVKTEYSDYGYQTN